MGDAAPEVSSDSERLILVDENDHDVGQLSKLECHEGDGVLHRAFSIFLFDHRGDVLLQRRSAAKKLWPGYWSNACCSHPRYGESMEEAVHRRLEQELNVSADLNYVYKFAYSARFGDVGSERELCWVWTGEVDPAEIRPNPNEIEDWQFMPTDELGERLSQTPERFTPWLRMEWSCLIEEFPAFLPGRVSNGAPGE